MAEDTAGCMSNYTRNELNNVPGAIPEKLLANAAQNATVVNLMRIRVLKC